MGQRGGSSCWPLRAGLPQDPSEAQEELCIVFCRSPRRTMSTNPPWPPEGVLHPPSLRGEQPSVSATQLWACASCSPRAPRPPLPPFPLAQCPQAAPPRGITGPLALQSVCGCGRWAQYQERETGDRAHRAHGGGKPHLPPGTGLGGPQHFTPRAAATNYHKPLG